MPQIRPRTIGTHDSIDLYSSACEPTPGDCVLSDLESRVLEPGYEAVRHRIADHEDGAGLACRE